eukprot:TRINITY_DN72613_c0_g1_i1.p1 TRINITY_DN72613_c0_g1~~TRINITY_DN72613_c0_g1_i1.p1  ORF type:complete len:296 (-),score=57.29 TRINITY_DN72613_c0_g1_i1:230-1117(-)
MTQVVKMPEYDDQSDETETDANTPLSEHILNADDDGRGNDGEDDVVVALPMKTCVACGVPFSWRKKWEHCWDEVLTCSSRCKSHRSQKLKPKGRKGSKEANIEDGATVAGNETSQKIKSKGKKGSKEPIIEDCTTLVGNDSSYTRKTLDEIDTMDKILADVAVAAEDQDDQDEAKPAGYPDVDEQTGGADSQRRLRRERQQALRAQRRQPQEQAATKQKPCDMCDRMVDLLIRCTYDDSLQWRMVCGRCWKKASGGMPDGDADHPNYRYGGLWKNRSAQVSTPKFKGVPAMEWRE